MPMAAPVSMSTTPSSASAHRVSPVSQWRLIMMTIIIKKMAVAMPRIVYDGGIRSMVGNWILSSCQPFAFSAGHKKKKKKKSSSNINNNNNNQSNNETKKSST